MSGDHVLIKSTFILIFLNALPLDVAQDLAMDHEVSYIAVGES